MTKEFVLDRLCIFINNAKLREQLYDDKHLSLQGAMYKIKSAELSKPQFDYLSTKTEMLRSETEEIRSIRNVSDQKNFDRNPDSKD